MTGAVTDTHSVIWYLLDDGRLSRRAGALFDACAAEGSRIHVPTMCIVEAIYLVEKRRIPEGALTLLDEVLGAEDSPSQVIGLTADVARAVRRVPRSTVPDLPDRVI